MPSWLERIKAMLVVTILSSQTIILAFVCMYLVWFISTSLDSSFRVVSTLLGGVVGFALGTVTFWRTIVKLSNQRGVSK